MNERRFRKEFAGARCGSVLSIAIVLFVFAFNLIPGNATGSPVRCEDVFGERGGRSTVARRAVTADEIESSVYAVHVTKIFPSDGILRTGYAAEERRLTTFRNTVHFALGEMVQSHITGNWETAQFAVVLPLRMILNQATNIYTHDSFVIGNFRIPAGAIVIVPHDFVLPSTFPNHIEVRRIPPNAALRVSVDQAIRERGGWRFRMNYGEGLINDTALWGGTNVNTREFFAPLLSRYPWLRFGPALNHPAKALDLFIGRTGLAILRNNLRSLSNETFEFLVLAFDRMMREAEVEAARIPSPEARSRIREKIRELSPWQELFALERRLRSEFGASLGDPTLIDEFSNGRITLTQVRTRIQERLSAGELVRVEAYPASDDYVLTRLGAAFHAFERRRLETLLGAEVNRLPARVRDRFFMSYAIRRLTNQDLDVSRREGLLDVFDSVFERLSRTDGPSLELEKDVFESLASALRAGGGALAGALAILNRPAVAAGLARMFEADLPSTGIDYDWILANHPETRRYIRDYVPLFRDDQARRTLPIIAAISSEFRDAFVTFEGTRALRSRQPDPIRMETLIGALNAPVASSQRLRQELQPRRLGSPHYVFVRLGLHVEYSQMFESDDTFLSSDLTFMEIYDRLRQMRESNLRR